MLSLKTLLIGLNIPSLIPKVLENVGCYPATDKPFSFCYDDVFVEIMSEIQVKQTQNIPVSVSSSTYSCPNWFVESKNMSNQLCFQFCSTYKYKYSATRLFVFKVKFLHVNFSKNLIREHFDIDFLYNLSFDSEA